MRIEDRRPRAHRFGMDTRESKLAYLRQRAPGLGGGRRLRVYALFASALLVFTAAAFYFTVKIFEAVVRQRQEGALMQVAPAAPVAERQSETAKALERVEAEQAAGDAEYDKQLEALQQVDLLEELDDGGL